MIKCLIVDDERPAINILTKFVNDTPYLTLVGSTTDVMEIPAMVKTHKADLLFLDIHMPKLTGLDFLKLHADENLKVILTTAYPQFALESYEFPNVVDYLMKPIPYERFLKATDKVLNIVNHQKLSTEGLPAEQQDFIFVKTEHKGKIQKINFSDIVYIEGMKNYVTICTTKGDRIVTYIGIGEIEESLPVKDFLRVHRSYIVAIKSIEALDGNEVIMKNAPRIPTAGKYKDDFLTVFQKRIVNLKNKLV
ncbi:LytTR family two component transcriptional regulator [Arcicella aurantiaca]|jgi:DNA-binding LytR/AlgR family response regulator|uniref:LytTR family two component transcriptional regulator n=1 Tax=Arcicella aurantiaca TaxID=591202 RepID=A0A316E1A4_9BACT|nr:LytTR family DNA-binding domain-containing protein [Arcicella aurantiaca]PWK23895.1 LytTR family two component transcriptional regulator [Arcicella aurantiaca]